MPDVIVIGGGVVGTAAALELARAGAEVTLYERGRLAGGASGASNGLVTPPDEPALVPLWQTSVMAYRELEASSRAGFALDDADIGTLTVATTEAQAAALAHATPMHGELLDAAAARAIEPALSEVVISGCLQQAGWRVNAPALTAALAAAASAAGADIVTGTPVWGLSSDPQGATVHTERGAHRADRALLAAGAWTRRLAGTHGQDVPVRPMRGWLMVTAPGPPLLRHVVLEAGWHEHEQAQPMQRVTVADLAAGHIPVTGAHAEHRLIAHPAAGGGVVLGGSRSPGLQDGAESAQATQAIARHGCLLIPEVGRREVVSVWTGLRPASPDGLPFVDWLDERVLVCAGHGSQGIITGGGSARLAAELLLGRLPFTDPEPFRLGRPSASPPPEP
ncbi:MAG: NAD(P)/FAD-dependent oxidoreductase [Gaiellales bacterium]